jgi:hypothetical protein
MKAFLHNNELYIKVIPGKRLFQSTMVHEVINRGDIFAVRLSDSLLTILDGNIQVEHIDIAVTRIHQPRQKTDAELIDMFDL